MLVVLFDPLWVRALDSMAIYYYGLPVLVCIELTYASAYENRRFADPWSVATAVSFAAGFLAWNIDYCRPTSWFQLHAVWHVLCAVATVTMYGMLANDTWAPRSHQEFRNCARDENETPIGRIP